MDTKKICQLYKYDQGSYVIKKESPSYFSVHFTRDTLLPEQVAWLNFHSLEDKDSIDNICVHLGIDKLTVEDIYQPKKRPKLEEYPNYLFFTVRSALSDPDEYGGLLQDQVSFLLGEGYLISFQNKKGDHFPDVRDRIERKRGKIRYKGSDFLLFRLLEAIIDNYFEVIQDISDAIDRIDEEVFHLRDRSTLLQIETQKRKLIELRKVVQPLRDVVVMLDNLQSPFIDRSNHHYFGDLKENCFSVLDEIDANKQILEGLANLYYATQGQRMNEIMKTLTIVSSIFIPLTFIVGVYGMNFENMPELRYKWGYYTILAVMVSIAIILVIYFRRIGWLGFRRKNKSN